MRRQIVSSDPRCFLLSHQRFLVQMEEGKLEGSDCGVHQQKVCCTSFARSSALSSHSIPICPEVKNINHGKDRNHRQMNCSFLQSILNACCLYARIDNERENE